jgi:ATP-dependent Clp protease ATP-binding subunit ClpC
MFERFTDRARRVVVLAQEEARMLNHNYIGTEHILLGLIHEGEGVAAKALESLGISLEAVRQQVEEIIGQGQQAPSGHIPFTPRAKKVLELSLREAQRLGHNYIGTEHILLGLIREGEGVAAQVLVKLGADLSRVRQQVIQLLHGYQGKEPAAAGEPPSGWAGREGRTLLPQLLDRVTAMESRLSAIEQRVGTGPDMRELDQQIDQACRDREAAIDAQDYENAAVLRDREKQLAAEKASRQEEWAAAHIDLPALAEEVRRLSGEIERLRRQQDTGPQNGVA